MTATLVLCYHAFSDTWDDPLAVHPRQLRSQLGLLAAHGFRSVRFTEAVTHRPTGRTVAITFDDAFSSVHGHALPVLADLGFVGTVFVPTAYLVPGGRLRWPGFDAGRPAPDSERTPLTWTQLRELRSAGWEIGSHTRTHARLPGTDDAELAEELGRSRADLEAGLADRVTSLAYPYGAVDARVRTAAAAAGYTAAAALGPQTRPPEPLWWPRVGIYRHDDLRRFRLKCSRPLRSAAAAGFIGTARALRAGR